MSGPQQPPVPQGWYPDGQGNQRWWDGVQWTEHVAPGQGTPGTDSGGSAGQAQPPHEDPTRVRDAPAAPQQPAYGQQPDYYGQQAGYYGQQQPGWGSAGGPPRRRRRGLLIGLVAGAAAVVVIVGVLVLTLALSGDGPEDVARDYVEAVGTLDIQTRCELVSREDREEQFENFDADSCASLEDALTEQLQQNLDTDIDEVRSDLDATVELGEVSETEQNGQQRAEVEYTATYTYSGDNQQIVAEEIGDGEEQTGTVVLVEEDGEWKVDEDESQTQ